MYCRYCGSELEPDDKFCRYCGAWVDSEEHHAPQTYYTPPKKSHVGRNVAVIVIAIIVLASAFIWFAPSYEDTRTTTVGDMTLTGDLTEAEFVPDGVGSLEYVGEGEPEWRYMDAYGTSFVTDDGVTFHARGFTSYVGDTLTFTEPGGYIVQVYIDGELRHSGTMTVDGEITDTYTWKYHQEQMSVTFTYEFSEFQKYADMDVKRWMYVGEDGTASRDFVVVDDAILRLSDALEETYASHFGDPVPGSQDYADYLLSFVQTKFDYPTTISEFGDSYILDDEAGNADMYLHGETEYWSFPMETIYCGMGDCEDTTFLLNALYSAARYKSANIIIPDHMLSAVVLDEFRGHTVPGLWLATSTLTSTGENLYFCETTFDDPAPAGYVTWDVHTEVLSLDRVVVIDPYEPA